MELLGCPLRLAFVSLLCCWRLLPAECSDHDVARWRRSVASLPHIHHGVRHHHVHHWGPFFEEAGGVARTDATLAMVVPLGGTVHLDCRVAMLHDKTVMWLRQTPDRVNLLTVGDSLYSSDPRISLKFQYPNNWRLRISGVQREDEGPYVCQVSTHPPRLLTTNLTVLAPELKIVDEHGHSVHDRYYKTGSKVELTCRVTTMADTGAVNWYRDGITLTGQLSSQISDKLDGVIFSRLVIPKANKADSGTYACALSKHLSVLVHVTILNGEYHAAVQHDTWNAGSRIDYVSVDWLLFYELVSLGRQSSVYHRLCILLFIIII